jgi:hypothetical protein
VKQSTGYGNVKDPTLRPHTALQLKNMSSRLGLVFLACLLGSAWIAVFIFETDTPFSKFLGSLPKQQLVALMAFLKGSNLNPHGLNHLILQSFSAQ